VDIWPITTIEPENDGDCFGVDFMRIKPTTNELIYFMVISLIHNILMKMQLLHRILGHRVIQNQAKKRQTPVSHFI